jgi:hypothetical protein
VRNRPCPNGTAKTIKKIDIGSAANKPNFFSDLFFVFIKPTLKNNVSEGKY